MHDAPERVKAFVDAMHEAKADFICQLGDFCQPQPAGIVREDSRFAEPMPRLTLLSDIAAYQRTDPDAVFS